LAPTATYSRPGRCGDQRQPPRPALGPVQDL
jgi:hypothetical protein